MQQDNTNTPLQEAEEWVAQQSPPPEPQLPMAAPPAFSSREIRIAAISAGTGLIVGLIVGVLVPMLVTAVGTASIGSPMTAAAATCDVTDDTWIDVGDGGRSVSMKSTGEESPGADLGDIVCVLTELEIPDSVMSRLDSTRALDGRQEATWNEFSASWGYHPDSGIDIVIEAATD